MNPVELVDILPTIAAKNPNAAIVYTVAKGFCNKKGVLQVKLGWIADHLGFDQATMKSACVVLQESELLLKSEEGVVFPQIDRFKASEKQTDLRHYASSVIPLGYEILLDEKQMYECYTTLGTQLWKVLAQVANFFHLDFPTVTRLMYNPEFKRQFLDVRAKVEQVAEISGQRVTKRKKQKESKKTIPELVEQLKNEVHIRNGEEIPKEEWKAPQLLRVFVLMYQKRYNEDYVFTTNPFGSLEMREIKSIAEAFEDNAFRTIKYLQWCFGVKSYHRGVMNPLRIRFCSADNVIREFIRNETAVKEVEAGGAQKPAAPDQLPTDFLTWIAENHSKTQETFKVQKIEDLKWLKQAHDSKSLPEELIPIVQEAIKRGLVNV